MKIRYLYYTLLILFISSCGSVRSTNDVLCEHVKVTNLKLDTTILSIFDFLEFNGNIIIENPYNTKQIFSIYSIEGDSLKYKSSSVYRGHGKNESMNGDLYKYDNQLFLTTNDNMVKVNEMYEISNIDEFASKEIFKNEIEIPNINEIWRIAPIDKNNYLVTFGGNIYNSMFGILNVDSQAISEIDIPYPVQDKKLNASKISSICQGRLIKRINKSEYIYSCRAGLNVFKFSIEDGETKDMKILYDSIPKYRVKSDGDYAFYRDDPSSYCFPSVSENYIYLLKAKSSGAKGNCIEVYDWNFNLIKKILLDKDVIYMNVSSDMKRIYFARSQDEEDIFCYININEN